jgi:hypothetical protein
VAGRGTSGRRAVSPHIAGKLAPGRSDFPEAAFRGAFKRPAGSRRRRVGASRQVGVFPHGLWDSLEG